MVRMRMFTLYFVALGAVALAVFAVLAEAIHRVASPPSWELAARHLLTAVSHAERRTRAMAFVGSDRRSRMQSVQMALDLAEARRAA